jgi:hypothetical protein
VLPLTDADLRRRLEGEVVEAGTKDNRPVYVEAYKFWTGHGRRHSYRNIVFTNAKAPADALNLYKGLGVTPRKGKIDRILAHIDEVICAGSLENNTAILNLLAWQIQNIGKPSRIVVVLITENQQAGKGIILQELMGKIYGPTGFVPQATDQIIGRFNDAIRGRAFFFLDEVLFSGDRRAADAVKSLSTTTEIGIETKGIPIVKCPVAVNLWLASNHENAAHIEEGDARYWVLKVSEHRIEDHAYFADLMQEIETGGREAFAYYLLNRDVSNFVPWRDVPKDNAAKREMIKHSINAFDARKWLEQCCKTEQIVGYMNDDTKRWTSWCEGEKYSFATLSNAYIEWQKTVRSPTAPVPTKIGNLGEVLNKAGITMRRTGSAGDRMRYLPNAQTCLENIWSKPPTDTPR